MDAFTLSSDTHVEVDLMTFGAAVVDWRVPANTASGKRSVVLGFDHIEPYLDGVPHLGSIVGRVAGRISGAGFSMDGEEYRLPANENSNTLHGGPAGMSRLTWQAWPDTEKTSVRFTAISQDGESGFPGRVTLSATYTLCGDTLSLHVVGEPDRKTPLNIIQHIYFNLGSGRNVLDHKVQINATAFLQTNDDMIPTGAIIPVARTRYDLRQARPMRDRFGRPMKFDVSYVLGADRHLESPVARVVGDDDQLQLSLATTRPSLQFYNGIYTNIDTASRSGRPYGAFSGFCLEDQGYVDAMNNRHFPPIWCDPSRPFDHTTRIEIGRLP